MLISSAKWANRLMTEILVTVDGVEVVAAAKPGLEAYDTVISNGTVIEPYTPTATDVRAEAQRRVVAMVGATDFNSCIVKQLNAMMRATELTNKLASGAALTEAEVAEAAQLHAISDGIKIIRACSNAMEGNPPADYTADSRWVLT